MPGCGKSTVGRQLARQLHLEFIDTDHAIEREIGMPIREFFQVSGEAAFRDVEQQVVDSVSQRSNAVLATGGGAVLRPANRHCLRQRAQVFYLRSTPEELGRRLRNDTHRPLLQGGDPLRRLRDLFQDRDPLYRETAHFVVESQRPSVGHLVGMVLMQLELAGLVDPNLVPSRVDAQPER